MATMIDDYIMNRVNIYKIFRVVAIIFLLALTSMIISAPKNKVSFASQTPTVAFSHATCENLDSNTLTYSTETFDIENSSFKRNVTVYFDIANHYLEVYYRFGVKSQQTEELELSWIKIDEDSQETEVNYQFESSGIYDIRCYIKYGEDIEVTDWITVKCDTDAPNELASINSMEEYQKGGTVFDVTFDTLHCSDELSGYKETYFSFTYTSSQKEHYSYRKADSGMNTFRIEDNGILAITYIDNAGNYATVEYEFDKFDKTAPLAPVIVITPDNDMAYAGGYAKSYTVTIAYGQDSQSGIAPKQYYVINGVTKEYATSFKLSNPSGLVDKQTVIRASTVDNVGNVSETTQEIILDNTFDVSTPIIRITKISIDLMSENTHTISFTATDTGSGVDNSKIKLDNIDTIIEPSANNTYFAHFSAFGKSSCILHVSDKVGNNTLQHIVINYFGDENKAKVIEEYHNIFHSLNFSEYRESAVDDIILAYERLNNALMAENTQNSQFDTLFASIDKLIAGNSNHSYIINTKPVYISSFIKYKICESDLNDYKKGDSVELVFNALVLDEQKSYVKLAGFSKGFAEAFNLSAYFKDQLLSQLEKGIEIEMNLPYKYYERQFAIINKTNNEIVPSMLYNNKIVFTIKDSGDYVMVISGDKSTDNSTTKTIKVFGKPMTYATFFGIIFGTLAGAGVLIGIITIVRKRRR
ncbi:MAG: hypothetical protein GX242_04525 [Clostridiales bacterium]|nr:hypothetical protein [Clostridiales bacterium]